MTQYFDDLDRYLIKNYPTHSPFASFLPGIAGQTGIPMWVFYVNRGQAISSFGITDKNHPIMEFQSANKAYQSTPYTGFRTFIKYIKNEKPFFYEPFAPWNQDKTQKMWIGMNELELEEFCSKNQFQTNISYFTLPGEDFAGLVRSVTVKNCGDESISIEIMDGMPAVIPYGVTNLQLKEFGRTIEAWMEVFNLEKNIPFYRVRASIEDKTEVETFKSGHFSIGFSTQDGQSILCSAFVDPKIIFGENTSLCAPDHFLQTPFEQLKYKNQITSGRTPCSFFGEQFKIEPSGTITIYSIYGNINSLESINQKTPQILNTKYILNKREEATKLALDLTSAIETSTNSTVLDAYSRQTYLDNIMRGGFPSLIKTKDRQFIYHIYSRKHGDTERDYNAFYLAPEFYSQGNGNFRDVIQNRRSDVLFYPEIMDINIHYFLSLIQIDGYNPLVVQGTKFTLNPTEQEDILRIFDSSQELGQILSKPFSPGELLKYLTQSKFVFDFSAEKFLSLVLQKAKQEPQADFNEGYWVDHWTYLLDLIESYLTIYPDNKHGLLFDDPSYPFYDSEYYVMPREEKYVLVEGRPIQKNTITDNPKKKAIIESRSDSPNLLRTQNGLGDIYFSALFSKLFLISIIKFATMDPWGMGIEMEAGRPGWYDAMNGLPGLFGSSMPETYELKRLLLFLLESAKECPTFKVLIPIETNQLLLEVIKNLSIYHNSKTSDRDYVYWDGVSRAREQYRTRVQMGIDGQQISLEPEKVHDYLNQFLRKVDRGISQALEINADLPPTYFYFQVDDFEFTSNNRQSGNDPEGLLNIRVKEFSPVSLPLFLEGFVRALKIAEPSTAQKLYNQANNCPLYDPQLKMYKVNESLQNQPHDIGRARAFTPGWLENESIWLHMEYKFMLEVLKAGLYDEFYEDFRNIFIPFLDPKIYGRSPTENSSFLVSSAHPDTTLHGRGFVARLSGATAEFLSIWSIMMAGKNPFYMKNGQLNLELKPILPKWLFKDDGKLSFRFLGKCWITYHNPDKKNTYEKKIKPTKIVLSLENKQQVEMSASIIPNPYADMVRQGKIEKIDVYLN